ncbi:uncharacterized protein P174DRAFT_461033 [Aspergillus novofumigatus IBT 16806]|uniref:Uncharacterized protein n=1 Tax=Aspergillus novofumigatus (strain IBT 16806) TaxID=1392255 RepID=A0A2I1C4E7_ASPN1|nr:uncharacterized protein P174DRAFT_461033 [Aspergillus novofumigatus IBT 16806]PKX92485.1 hypothetical protein P174DRAFT_461033 [Aspergillus novofumigatus IBT 16806]
MPRSTKIPRTRWSESEKLRLLNYRDRHPNLPWDQIKLDLKIEREKEAREKSLMLTYLMLIRRTMVIKRLRKWYVISFVISCTIVGVHANIPRVDQSNNQNKVTNTTQLSKGNKRLLDLGDNETHPSKQTKTGDVAANNVNDPDFDPSEASDIGRSPTARQLRNTPRKQLNDTVVGSASGLKRPSKSTKLQFTGQPGARDPFSTTPASPDPHTLQNAKKSNKTTKSASASSQPTLSDSRSLENAADTNKSDATSAIESPVQRARPSLSPATNRHSAQNQEPSTNNEDSPSKPEQEMAPRPPTPPFSATTAFTDSGSNEYQSMQHGARLFTQAAMAMREFPKERARNAQLDETNENLMMELLKLEEKGAEWKQEIRELQLHNRNLEGDLKKQIDQVKKLEAELKEMSEKKNQGALDAANGATNTECEHCLEHISRLNALTEENKKLKQKLNVVAEVFAAGNDQT